MPLAALRDFRNPSYWPANLGRVDVVIAIRLDGQFIPMPYGDFKRIGPFMLECINDTLRSQFQERYSLKSQGDGYEYVVLVRDV